MSRIECARNIFAMRSDPLPLVLGQTPAEVIKAFVSQCNHGPNVLFITESWFEPYRQQLLVCLPPALTDTCRDALGLAIRKQRSLGAVLTFIQAQPLTWAEYDAPSLAAKEDIRRRNAVLRRVLLDLADRVRTPPASGGPTTLELADAALATLKSAMQEAKAAPFGATTATAGVLRREDPNGRPIWLSFFDERIVRNDPTFVVRYLFGPDGRYFYLTISVCGRHALRQPFWKLQAHFRSRLTIPSAMEVERLPAGTLGPARGGRITEKCVVVVRRYDRKALPDPATLVEELRECFGVLQFIAYSDEASRSQHVGGMGVMRWSSLQGVFGRSAAVSERPRLFDVLFATDRELDSQGEFTFGRSSRISFGKCAISIPQSHTFGSVGSNWWRRLLSGDDRLSIKDVTPLSERDALETVKRSVAQADQPDVLLYIHGYNTSFTDAAIRAGQIGADLKAQTTVFFSWPSAATVSGYLADSDAVEVCEDHLLEWLNNLTQSARRVHILAHSMGTRALLRIAVRVAVPENLKLGQVMLAAADIDEGLFKTRAPSLVGLSERTTLYASQNDMALDASGFLHEYPRAGFIPPVTVVSGIDTLEASDVDLSAIGHGYFGEAEAVLYDMFVLMRQGLPPEQRPRLHAIDLPNGSRYWRIIK